MNTKILENEACRRVVRVELGADEIRDDYEKILKVYVSHAKIPGFRPGKAPRDRVATRYRKDIEKELQDTILPRAYREMIEKEALEPVAVIDLQDVQASVSDGFRFTAVLDVKPTFKLPKYKKITVETKSTEVKDADIDETIQDILKRMSRYVDAESGALAEEQDLVQVDYEAKGPDGSALALEGEGTSELLSGQDYWLPMAGDNELIPGLLEALRGQAMGSDVTFTAKYPSDYRVAALAGQKVAYELKIKGLRKMQVPTLDEEILKRMGVESEEALRTRVRADLETARKDEEQNRQREQVNQFLLENTKITVPDSHVSQERSTMLRSLLTRLAQQGATREMLEQHRDEMMANVSRQAEERVKLLYILAAIAKEEELKLEDADIDASFEKLSERYGMPVERLRAEIEKQDDGMDKFREDVLRDKVMDFLLGQAKIK